MLGAWCASDSKSLAALGLPELVHIMREKEQAIPLMPRT